MKKIKVVAIKNKDPEMQSQEFMTKLESEINLLTKDIENKTIITSLLNILDINWIIEEV